MTARAEAKYFWQFSEGVFRYDLHVENVSTDASALYAVILGGQFDAAFNNPTPFFNVTLTGAPPGWTGATQGDISIAWHTDPPGSLNPGQTGIFSFTSTTPPPAELLFGCGFTGLSIVNGIAHRLGDPFMVNPPPLIAPPRAPRPSPFINPLVFVLGDELFVRLNLPRPANLAGLREQLTASVRAMSPEQRRTAATALGAHINALAEARAALEATNER
jgi:hypothetical protein